MTQEEWSSLSREMAIEAITMDLADSMIPASIGRPRAIRCLDQRDQQAVNVEYKMGQALLALKRLGYEVTKTP